MDNNADMEEREPIRGLPWLEQDVERADNREDVSEAISMKELEMYQDLDDGGEVGCEVVLTPGGPKTTLTSGTHPSRIELDGDQTRALYELLRRAYES